MVEQVPDYETLKQALLAKGYSLPTVPSRPYLLSLTVEEQSKVPILASRLPNLDKRLLGSS